MMRGPRVVIAAVVVAIAGFVASCTTPPPPPPAHWSPGVGTTFQVQYSGLPIDTTVDAQAYDLDGFDTDAALVTQLHGEGRKVICYLSAGSWEDWRPDAAQYPAEVKGKNLDGWPGEKWVDVRRLDLLRPIFSARMDLCKQKGFDAVDPDNVDGYTNDTGFPLTAADQLAFNRFLADLAHARGLAVGLKNDVDQVAQLVSSFDFAVNEQCAQYDECDLMVPFITAGKPVFELEYSLALTAFCPSSNALGFTAMKKHLSLDAYRAIC